MAQMLIMGNGEIDMNKLKILIINTANTGKNGITNVIYNLLSFSKETEMQFDYLAINDACEEYVNTINKKNGSFYVLKRREIGVYKYLYKLAEIIKKNKYDIIHIHGNSHTLFLELLAAKIGGNARTIIHSHASDSKYRIIHKLLNIPFNCLLDVRVACSDSAGKWMFGNKSYLLLNNGIDSKKFTYSEFDRNAIRARLNIDSNTKVLCHVGMFDNNKNQAFLIKIIENFKNSDVVLILLGDGVLKRQVEKLTEENNTSHKVRFIGSVDDVHRYLSAADIFIMPSHYEGFPMTLIEAQANGLHCIVSDTITRTVNITNNVYFMNIESDSKEWADRISKICTDDRVNRSEEACKSIIGKGYDIRQISLKLDEIYYQISQGARERNDGSSNK